jgi:DMSO/TMAO reductase YedYZ heme-binding membrane subunit
MPRSIDMTELTWYVARSSGIIAWIMLSASVIWGLAISGKMTQGKVRPNWMLDFHRFLGGAAVVLTGIHVGSLLVDTYTDFGIVDVLVPLTGDWHPVAVAWGIVGMYLLAAVEITSLLRSKMSKRAWKLTHFSSYPVFAFSTIHLLTAGTDAGNVVLRAVTIAATMAVAGLTAVRVEGVRQAPTRRTSSVPI